MSAAARRGVTRRVPAIDAPGSSHVPDWTAQARHAIRLSAAWPNGVDLQLHILEGDEDFPFAQALSETVPGAQLFVYAGTEHYFAEHDDEAAGLLTNRVLDFLEAQ